MDDAPIERTVRRWPRNRPMRLAADIPRLGLIHLLGWTACTAAYLGLARWMVEIDAPYPPGAIRQRHARMDRHLELPGTLRAYNAPTILLFAQSPLAGAALGEILLWFAWRKRGIEFPAQPGETMLLIMGTDLAMQLPLVLCLAHTQAITPSWLPTMLILVCVGIRMALYGIMVERDRGPERWRSFLALVVLQSVLCCFSPLMVPLLVGIMVFDLFERTRFSWLHWIGAVVCFWQLLTGGLLYPGGVWTVFLGLD